MVGGSVYALMDKQPMAKRLPLFSLRGSDCFVSCMDGHGNVVKKLRLTLLDCVDVAPIALKRHRHQTTTMATASRAPTNQSKSPTNGIALCPLDHPHQSFCLVNRQICAGLYATAPTYVHLGASKCKWVL
ncbi:hypothetical protein DYB38_012446 [Aphanomyces astaci]|uniref:Uncharacterized protein n=1 Tax=Aphanomyces astaci TaxID=112090 RepID=A0A397C7N9_APHAT|nr:hypothetical protein DYB38_012446 [Aphanomyces astaci]